MAVPSWFAVLAVVILLLCAANFFVLRIRRRQDTLRQRMEARGAERERIARDLRDTLLQGIQALCFRLQTWTESPVIPLDQRHEIALVARQTRAIPTEGRERLTQLRHGHPRASELAEGLDSAASATSMAGGPALQLKVPGRWRQLTMEAYDELWHIGREAIRNAYQHSGATSIKLTLNYHRRALRMSVEDNGRGINLGTISSPGHYGLLGIQERIKLLRGGLSI